MDHCICFDPLNCTCYAGRRTSSSTTDYHHVFPANPPAATPSTTMAPMMSWPPSQHATAPPANVYSFQPAYYTPYYPQPPSAPQAPAELAIRQVVFDDTTARNVNTPAQPVSTTKRKNTSSNSSAAKRRNTQANSTTAPAPVANTTATSIPPSQQHQAVPGIGPQTDRVSTTQQHPSFTRNGGSTSLHGSLLVDSSVPTSSVAQATDVWYFTRGLKTDVRPDTMPEKETPTMTRPDVKEFDHLGCMLCPHSIAWTTWKNTAGQTKAIREHMKKKHFKMWREMVVLRQLKGWTELASKSSVLETQNDEPTEREAFSLDGFYERLVRWIAVDDQSLDVVDSPELRSLLLYTSVDLKDSQIPHRTKISELITAAFQREYRAMVTDISNSLGRVSFTSDIWSRMNMESYMAVTAHYASKSSRTGNLEIKTQLVAFRRLHGSHSGMNIGKVFLQIIKEIDCLHKISMITLDNASNNDTMMQQLEDELQPLNIPFDKVGNRVRCFPHVINIAVKAGLKHLTEVSAFDPDLLNDTTPDLDVPIGVFDKSDLDASAAYQAALQCDLISYVRRFVNAVRSSGQRREQFEKILEEGNLAGGWGPDLEQLRNVGLLKDVDTRWSSTFVMLDRFLELYPVVKHLLVENDELGKSHCFDDIDIKILTHVRRFLYFFHVVQELVSAEKTPTLSIVLPMYEKLIIMLRNDLTVELPGISHAILASVAKLEEYLKKSRQTKMYAIAMAIHPTIKLEWLKKNWSDEEYESARQALFDSLLEYQQHLRKTSSRPSHTSSQRVSSASAASASATVPCTPEPATRRVVRPSSSSHAARNQSSGYARFQGLKKSFSAPSISSAELPTPIVELSPEAVERMAVEEDKRIVAAEIAAWEAAGVIGEDDPRIDDFDLLRFWQANQSQYPLLWRVALDALPVQASAVPCERVFSSSKETDTSRRSNLSSYKMEELQVLKFGYRNDRMSFTDHLVCSEHELSVLDMSPAVVEDLFSRGMLSELENYIDESWRGWGNERVKKQG